MERSPIKDVELKVLLKAALTNEINSREVYMKGIDHSYYYEGYTTFKTEDLSKEWGAHWFCGQKHFQKYQPQSFKVSIWYFELLAGGTGCFGADRTKPDHQAAGACERNWQVHCNREADHEVLAG